jgi:hypothetical protein
MSHRVLLCNQMIAALMGARCEHGQSVVLTPHRPGQQFAQIK